MAPLAPRTRRALVAVALAAGLAACGSSGGSAGAPPAPSGSTGASGRADSTRQPLVAHDVAAVAGVERGTNTHGADCVADIDGDGRRDLILSTHGGGSGPPAWPLMLGRGNGRFERDPRFDLAPQDRHGCAVADFDGDGRLDVFLSIGGCKGKCRVPKELWIQQPDHSFEDEAARWGVDDPDSRGRVPLVLNVNGDHRPDLFVGAEQGVRFTSSNRLWVNRGDHFSLQKGPVTNDDGNLCAAAADVDGDGLDELAVCTSRAGFVLYRNDGGKLRPATNSYGLLPFGRRSVTFADLDGDRRPDLVSVTRSQLQISLNRHGAYRTRPTAISVTDGRDVAAGDVDGDGDLDLYVQQVRAPDELFLNDGDGRHFTRGLTLPGKSGIGDTVVAIPDWKGTGRAAMLVNNGYLDARGPRQLFEFTGG